MLIIIGIKDVILLGFFYKENLFFAESHLNISIKCNRIIER
ncbi:hypothetical protein ACFLZ0_02615 [Patescibacteria group bacterium]